MNQTKRKVAPHQYVRWKKYKDPSFHIYIFPIYQSVTELFMGGYLSHFVKSLPHQYISFSFPSSQPYPASVGKCYSAP